MNIKERLKQYIDLNNEIDFQIDRLDRLNDKLFSAGISTPTGTPRSSSPNNDRIADMLARKEEIEETIQSLVKQMQCEREQLETLISGLNKPAVKAVLRLRYLDFEEWEDVLFVMFGGKPDYDENYDNYKHRMYSYHKQGLNELDNILQREEVQQ